MPGLPEYKNDLSNGTHDADTMNTTRDLLFLVRESVRKVNTASRGRLSFIEEITERSRNIASSVEEMGFRAEENNQRLDQSKVSLEGVFTKLSEISNILQQMQEKEANVTAALTKLTEDFNRVEVISSSIADIAKQTRMLSLNAMIEAVRAGHHGSGFAVVAQEVKALANTTAQSADSIDQVMRGLGDRVEDINTHCGDLNSQMIEGVDACKKNIDSMDVVYQDVADAVEGSKATAQQAQDQMNEFSTLVNQIETIRDNTKTAIHGSAENFKNVSKVLTLLGTPVDANDLS